MLGAGGANNVTLSMRSALKSWIAPSISESAMSHLAQIAKAHICKLPEVAAAVVTDRSGMLVDSTGDVDGETVGAVHAVSADALARTGEILGMGPLQRATITGGKKACVIVTQDEEIAGIYVDPAKPIGTFETKLDTVLRR